MTCPRCQAPMVPQAAFCANCGMALGVPSRPNFWWGAVVGLMAVGGLVAVLFATGVLQLRGNPTPAAITQLGEAPPPITAKGPKQMPDDVRAWLEHLERIEKKRVALAQKQLAQVMVAGEQLKGAGIADILGSMLDDSDESTKAPEIEKAEATLIDVRKPWAELADEFNTLPPPPGCQEVAVAYDQALRETGATVGDIQDVVTNAMADPQGAIEKLQKIRGSHTGSIDDAASRTDKGVQAICDAYDTRKWFSIQRDIGSGMPGLTMPNIGGLTP